MLQECIDLGLGHLGRMPKAVEANKPPDPPAIGLFGPAAIVAVRSACRIKSNCALIIQNLSQLSNEIGEFGFHH
jgi:hypothetical protein